MNLLYSVRTTIKHKGIQFLSVLFKQDLQPSKLLKDKYGLRQQQPKFQITFTV